jgi:hypothetical protein
MYRFHYLIPRQQVADKLNNVDPYTWMQFALLRGCSIDDDVSTPSTTGASFLHNSSSRKENRNDWNEPSLVCLAAIIHLRAAACHGTTSWCVRPPVVALDLAGTSSRRHQAQGRAGSAASVSVGVGNQTIGEDEHRVAVCEKDGGGCVAVSPGWMGTSPVTRIPDGEH